MFVLTSSSGRGAEPVQMQQRSLLKEKSWDCAEPCLRWFLRASTLRLCLACVLLSTVGRTVYVLTTVKERARIAGLASPYQLVNGYWLGGSWDLHPEHLLTGRTLY